MSQQWFDDEYVCFFKELSANNHREWFHANKKRYETHVKKPFYNFVEELLDKTGFEAPVKDCVFRINRDIRFSPDKRPYKTHMSAVISPAGRKNMQVPGLYVHFEIGNVMIGGGAYMPDKENLRKIRMHLVKHTREVNRLLQAPEFVEVYGGLSEGDKNKILPKDLREYGQDHPIIYNKQFYFMASYEDEAFVTREDLLDVCLNHFKVGRAWNNFILQAIYS